MDYAMHNWCIQLYQNLFSQPPYEEKFTNEDVINEFEDYFKLNKEWIFFAKDKWKIIGFGVVVPIMNSAVDKVLSEKIVQQWWDKEKCYYMADLWVDPEYQRYSIGTDLVLSRINSLPKGSIIIMRTSLNNYKSQGLYKKLWFQRIEDTIEKVKQERIDGTTTEDERLFLYHIK
jgi:ribosomal protein S18 acetylase RimI-like enzyme